MKTLFSVLILMASSSALAGNDDFECTEGFLPEVTLSCTNENSGLKFEIYLEESAPFCVDNGDPLPARLGRLNGVEVLTEVDGPAFDPATGYYSVSYKNGMGALIKQNRCTLAP